MVIGGVAWCGVMWRGVAVLIEGSGMAWHGVAWRGMAKHGVSCTSGG